MDIIVLISYLFYRRQLAIRRVTKDSNTLPANAEILIGDFRRRITQLSRMHLLINMDQTSVHFDMTPSQTVDRRGNDLIHESDAYVINC